MHGIIHVNLHFFSHILSYIPSPCTQLNIVLHVGVNSPYTQPLFNNELLLLELTPSLGTMLSTFDLVHLPPRRYSSTGSHTHLRLQIYSAGLTGGRLLYQNEPIRTALERCSYVRYTRTTGRIISEQPYYKLTKNVCFLFLSF